MRLIVGLGNPGKEYADTRHNTGFMFAHALAKKLNFPEFTLNKKFNALVCEGQWKDEKLIIAKPQTFMNSSGESVAKMFLFYHGEPEDLWIIYDDIDLALGKIRMRSEGSAGTHNGMKSVIEKLGFSNFPRLRIGIESRSRGASVPLEQDITSFVLHPFEKKEKKLLEAAVESAIGQLLEKL